jgi:hypothetical protein
VKIEFADAAQKTTYKGLKVGDVFRFVYCPAEVCIRTDLPVEAQGAHVRIGRVNGAVNAPYVVPGLACYNGADLEVEILGRGGLAFTL